MAPSVQNVRRGQALDDLIMAKPSCRKKVVVNLGCGSDVLPWQCGVRYPDACRDVTFIDVDYPDLIQKKRRIVLDTPELHALLGTWQVNDKSPIVLESQKYCQIACDLRQLSALENALSKLFDLSATEFLFVAEVSITYMDTEGADGVISWAGSFQHAEFCLLEQILPDGPDHPFAHTMLKHFNKLNTPIKSVHRYPSVASQEARFGTLGWSAAESWTLWEAWADDLFMTSEERRALDVVEPFDEWEEFALFASHYVVILASTFGPDHGRHISQKPGDSTIPSYQTHMKLSKYEAHRGHRRFGAAMLVENPNDPEPVVSFEIVDTLIQRNQTSLLSRFGATVINSGEYSFVFGGVIKDVQLPAALDMIIVKEVNAGLEIVASLDGFGESGSLRPFLIGASVVPHADGEFAVVGGGATCFSMGTCWTQGSYNFAFDTQRLVSGQKELPLLASQIAPVEYSETVEITADETKASTEILPPVSLHCLPRIKVESKDQFHTILDAGKPVIIESSNLGPCVSGWSQEYLVKAVGADREVSVHESTVENMDFNAKNFRYVTKNFGEFIKEIGEGKRLYLRALSKDEPSNLPTQLATDYPSLAKDFTLPPQLAYVQDNTFSSVLRISGPVNMWLHYDVMANVYAQPYEAVVEPGDILFLPPLWLHTAAPTSDMSVAVNIFFRNLEKGYSSGRDVYGNRDLAAYEKGRQDVSRIANNFSKLPPDAREFYIRRLADELLQLTMNV
ncbi:tRNA wybutosine-synthesizing protein 4 [Colletotrichum sp. SAR11_59]|nr:tRNA wybutosine-synthesizing protein 4 [Colletotrichum sp. SAR11_59]